MQGPEVLNYTDRYRAQICTELGAQTCTDMPRAYFYTDKNETQTYTARL